MCSRSSSASAAGASSGIQWLTPSQLRVAERAPPSARGLARRRRGSGRCRGRSRRTVRVRSAPGPGRAGQRDRPVPVQRRGERGRVGEAGGVALGALPALARPDEHADQRRRPRPWRPGRRTRARPARARRTPPCTTTRAAGGAGAARAAMAPRGRHGDPGDGADAARAGSPASVQATTAPQSCPTTCARDRPVSASAASTTAAASATTSVIRYAARPVGPGARRVATLVRRERAQAGGGQRGRDGLPAARRLREPVQQHHRLPVRRAGRGHVEDQPVPLHRRRPDRLPPRTPAAPSHQVRASPTSSRANAVIRGVLPTTPDVHSRAGRSDSRAHCRVVGRVGVGWAGRPGRMGPCGDCDERGNCRGRWRRPVPGDVPSGGSRSSTAANRRCG